jgi:signal transduction protein with GAF and PtsI domain
MNADDTIIQAAIEAYDEIYPASDDDVDKEVARLQSLIESALRDLHNNREPSADDWMHAQAEAADLAWKMRNE